MKYCIGIDIGTGSTKAVALNLSFKAIASSQHYYPTHAVKLGYSEQEPKDILQAFISCIDDLISELGNAPIAIGLSSAMHSLILVDDAGAPISPMLTWADNRSADIAKALLKDDGLAIYAATGTPIHAMSPLCKIIWFKKEKLELFKLAAKFISIKEYIWHSIFGEYKIDHSIASCTGLFNLAHLAWHNPSLNLCGITANHLSTPVETGYIKASSGASKIALFNTHNINFVIGASDGCLANLGSEAIVEGTAAITIGTSGAFRLASATPVINEQAMTFSYILDSATFICGGPINNGGLALQWLIKNVFGKTTLAKADYDALFTEVDAVEPGSQGLIFLPYLTGERAPIWNSEASGSFFGLSINHAQKHLARAVVEGICFALNDVLKAVETPNLPIKKINASGGFVHSKTWMQILANVTGKQIVLITEEDASAVGAAYLAAKATKLSEAYPTSAHKNPEVIYPDAEVHKIYVSKFELYKQVYSDLKHTMKQINQN